MLIYRRTIIKQLLLQLKLQKKKETQPNYYND